MKLNFKSLAVISIALVSLPQTAVSSFADEAPVSGPYYQLVTPATETTPARYRYFENGNNQHFGAQVFSDSNVTQAQIDNANSCPPEGCTRVRRFGQFVGGVVVGALAGIIN